MAEIYITLKVNAKDKLEATAKVNSVIKDRIDMDIEGISSDNPYKINDETCN